MATNWMDLFPHNNRGGFVAIHQCFEIIWMWHNLLSMATNRGEFLYNNALRLHKCDVISPWQQIEANLLFYTTMLKDYINVTLFTHHGNPPSWIYFYMKMVWCHINVTHSSTWQPTEMAYCVYNNSARLHICHANFSKRIDLVNATRLSHFKSQLM